MRETEKLTQAARDLASAWESDRIAMRSRDETDVIQGMIEAVTDMDRRERLPVPMILTCPSCNGRHIDEGEFATKVHHTHACQHCGMVWRPAIVATVGVRFLPGFKNEEASR